MQFPVSEPEKENKALLKMLFSLRNLCAPLYNIPIKIFYCGKYHDWPGPAERPSWNKDAMLLLPDPFWYLAAVHKRSWLGRLRYPYPFRQVMIFSIHPGFYGTFAGRKEINCHVLDPQIRFFAERALHDYAGECNATRINCSGLPGSKNHFASSFCF